MNCTEEVDISNLHKIRSKYVTLTPTTKKAIELTGYTLTDFFIPKNF